MTMNQWALASVALSLLFGALSFCEGPVDLSNEQIVEAAEYCRDNGYSHKLIISDYGRVQRVVCVDDWTIGARP